MSTSNDIQPPLQMKLGAVNITYDRLAWVFVCLGIIACSVRYALCFPLIWDEASLAMNMARRDYAGLFGELEFGQMAPPLFLLAVEFCSQVLTLHEWSLRLPAFAGAIGALLMFPLVARQLLAPKAYLMAVAIFSVSYWPLRYGAEAKPYSLDMLFTCLWLWLALKWMSSHHPWRWTALMLAPAILGFGISFPSIFAAGGALIAMAFALNRHTWPKRLLHAGVVGITLLASFAFTYLRLVPAQSATAQWMQNFWQDAFPPTDSIGNTLWWFVQVFTGELMPYPVGGEDFASTGTFLLVVLGLVILLKSRSYSTLTLLLAPVLLGLVAGFLHKYPFGLPTRMQLYLAPVFCLLAGCGLASFMHFIGHRFRIPKWRSPMRATCIVLAILPIATIARDIVLPQKSVTDAIIRDATRVIWSTADSVGHRPLSLREDLNAAFTETTRSEITPFLANYHIQVATSHTKVNDQPISSRQSVQVVTYRVDGQYSPSLRNQWIKLFEEKHQLELAGSIILKIPHLNKNEELIRHDEIEILSFRKVGAAE